MTTPTKALAAAAVEIIFSVNSSAEVFTEVDARIADADLIMAHMNNGQMDDATRARATRTLLMLKNGKRRYRA